ncbi:MAG: Gfo/Idh/MocA family oxidoreductase [Kiritimatiellaeota bacterium]|nr:Gfo/Idh/MocA family oxidoreductase [Kiritimatiellota bacterium]
MNQQQTSRRNFIKTGVLAGLALPHVFSETSRAQAPAPNSRLGVGFIGCGGRAGAHMHMLEGLKKEGMPIEFVAVCDVYRPHAERAKKHLNAGQLFMDHHELLARKDIDLVCIATPDHHHGYQAIDALQAGKHVYCEKPVTHWRQFDLTRKLADVAAASPCTFQLGTQAMSDGAWHQMKKLVKEGLIGKPLFGETSFFRIGDWGERGMHVDDPNAKPGPDLNWEAFLGDAPKRDFSVDRFFRWRLFEDYAGGPVTDLFPHSLTPSAYSARRTTTSTLRPSAAPADIVPSSAVGMARSRLTRTTRKSSSPVSARRMAKPINASPSSMARTTPSTGRTSSPARKPARKTPGARWNSPSVRRRFSRWPRSAPSKAKSRTSTPNSARSSSDPAARRSLCFRCFWAAYSRTRLCAARSS